MSLVNTLSVTLAFISESPTLNVRSLTRIHTAAAQPLRFESAVTVLEAMPQAAPSRAGAGRPQLLAAAALLAALLLPPPVTPARVPGSPFPVPALGLNSSRALLAWDVSSGSQADLFAVQTLQGVLAQRAPRVFRFDSSPGAAPYALWLNETARLFGVAVDSSHARDAAGLIRAAVAAFPGDVAGYALAALDDNSTNACVAAAAAARVMCVTAANERDAEAAGLAKLFDVRGRGLAWALETFGTGNFSRSVTVLQRASESVGCMSDFSIASRALQWWLDDVTLDPLAWLVWGALEPPFAMLGWGPDEYNTVTRRYHTLCPPRRPPRRIRPLTRVCGAPPTSTPHSNPSQR